MPVAIQNCAPTLVRRTELMKGRYAAGVAAAFPQSPTNISSAMHVAALLKAPGRLRPKSFLRAHEARGNSFEI